MPLLHIILNFKCIFNSSRRALSLKKSIKLQPASKPDSEAKVTEEKIEGFSKEVSVEVNIAPAVQVEYPPAADIVFMESEGEQVAMSGDRFINLSLNYLLILLACLNDKDSFLAYLSLLHWKLLTCGVYI